MTYFGISKTAEYQKVLEKPLRTLYRKPQISHFFCAAVLIGRINGFLRPSVRLFVRLLVLIKRDKM